MLILGDDNTDRLQSVRQEQGPFENNHALTSGADDGVFMDLAVARQVSRHGETTVPQRRELKLPDFPSSTCQYNPDSGWRNRGSESGRTS